MVRMVQRWYQFVDCSARGNSPFMCSEVGMLCVSVAVWSKNARTAYLRVAIVIREKFIRLKALGIEVQGHKDGSFFK